MEDSQIPYQPINAPEEETQIPHSVNCFSRKLCWKFNVWQLLVSLFLLFSGLILLSYFAIIPSYIQKVINKAEVNFVSIVLSNLTENKIVVSAVADISGIGSISATMLPRGPFSLSYSGSNLGFVTLPTIHAGGDTITMNITEQSVAVNNISIVEKFASDMINNSEVNWEIEGLIDVIVWKIPFHKFKFNKIVTIAGMSGLQQIQVHDFQIPGDSEGQFNLTIDGSIYNPSYVVMQVGDINFDIIFNNCTIGSLLAPQVTLADANNNIAMTGFIKPADDKALAAVNVFVNQYISGANSTISVRGTSGSIFAPSWLNSVIQTLLMTTTLSGPNNLTLIYNISLSQMVMNLPGNVGESTDSGIVVLSSFFSSGFQSPFPISLKFLNVTISAMMSNYDIFGYLPISTYEITEQTTNTIGFQMTNSSLQIVNRPAFMDLVDQLVNSPSTSFTIFGTASANALSQVGVLTLNNIAITQEIFLDGLNGFLNAISVIEPNDHITAGHPWGFQMYLNTAIYNPSSASLYFAGLSFDFHFQGTFIGNGTAANIFMDRGMNRVFVNGNYVSPENKEFERQFLSSYIQGNSTIVTLVGNKNNIPLLVPAMAKLNVTVIFPGNTQPFLRWVTPSTIFPVTGKLALFNPVEFANFKIYKTDWTYFTYAYDTTFEPPFVISPSETEITHLLD